MESEKMSRVFHDPAAWLRDSDPVITVQLPADVFHVVRELAAEEGKTTEKALVDFITGLARS
jgi:hypothetical protein